MRDVAAADPLEALAREKGVTYVKLDGQVGILGNELVSWCRRST